MQAVYYAVGCSRNKLPAYTIKKHPDNQSKLTKLEKSALKYSAHDFSINVIHHGSFKMMHDL